MTTWTRPPCSGYRGRSLCDHLDETIVQPVPGAPHDHLDETIVQPVPGAPHDHRTDDERVENARGRLLANRHMYSNITYPNH